MMKWILYFLLTIMVGLGVYSAVVYYGTDETESFTIEKEVPFPIEKVYPQFSNFQQFTDWNEYFSEDKKYIINYFQPYEGEGSSISFRKENDATAGEMFIRQEAQNKGLKYQLFEVGDNQPFEISVKFSPINAEKTKIIWQVNTPKLPFFRRHQNFWGEEYFVETIDKSLQNLNKILANNIDRDQQINKIQYDTIITEQMEAQVLLGVHSNALNKKEMLFNHIVKDYNKVMNFAKIDLAKREDEIGYPTMIGKVEQNQAKSIAYFLGVPLSEKMAIKDQNFTFQDVKPSKIYSIFYKGTYENRSQSIQKLLQKVKKDTLQHGDLIQTFLEIPEENKDLIMKISVQVFR